MIYQLLVFFFSSAISALIIAWTRLNIHIETIFNYVNNPLLLGFFFGLVFLFVCLFVFFFGFFFWLFIYFLSSRMIIHYNNFCPIHINSFHSIVIGIYYVTEKTNFIVMLIAERNITSMREWGPTPIHLIYSNWPANILYIHVHVLKNVIIIILQLPILLLSSTFLSSGIWFFFFFKYWTLFVLLNYYIFI